MSPILPPDLADVRAAWSTRALIEKHRRAARKARQRQATGLRDASATRSALWTFLDRRYPTPAYRSGMPGADWVKRQVRKRALYQAVLRMVLEGLSAARALAGWDRNAGEPPTPYELERQAADFRASMAG